MESRVQRVRYDGARFRELTIARIEDLSPRYRRMVLTGDLAGFESTDAADHLKIVIPAPGAERLPTRDAVTGEWSDDQPRPVMRDYTPRFWDADTGELAIDFFLHNGDIGPVSAWASSAETGKSLGILGPRGSQIVDLNGLDWVLLVGDETALPSIARRIESLPAGMTAHAFIEIDNTHGEQAIASPADAEIHWIHRGLARPGTTTLLEDALRDFEFPSDNFYGWLMGNADNLRDIRRLLFSERGVAREKTRFTGHWKRNQANFDHHGVIEE